MASHKAGEERFLIFFLGPLCRLRERGQVEQRDDRVSYSPSDITANAWR